MKAKVISSVKTSYPCQSSNLGSVIVKVLLCLTEDEHYFCCMGSGEDKWLMENGKRLTLDEASSFFKNIHFVENRWKI